jgi:hypothetical protein
MRIEIDYCRLATLRGAEQRCGFRPRPRRGFKLIKFAPIHVSPDYGQPYTVKQYQLTLLWRWLFTINIYER